MLSIVLPVSATGIGDIRVNARFLTDRMAFELNLNSNQYDDLYEVNYDFLRNVDPYLTGMGRQDAYALDSYYRYLDERNDDLRWILSNMEYTRFLSLDYFFRPIYVLNHLCGLRVYQRYPNRDYFYYRQPAHYVSYRGGHGRAYWRGVSYYERNYSRRYNHPVYRGDYRVRPEHRRHDFAPAPRPMGRPDSRPHATPMQPPRPGNSSHAPQRPDMERPRPGMSRPDAGNNRWDNKGNVRPNSGNSRPSARPESSRPSRDNGQWNHRQDTPKRQDNPSFNRERKENQSVRPGRNTDENRHSNPRRSSQSDSRFKRDL